MRKIIIILIFLIPNILLSEQLWEIYDSTISKLPDNYVMDIKINGETIWFGSHSGFTQYYDDSFTTYLTSYQGESTNWINDIAIDSTGNVWIATAKTGILKYSGGIDEKFDESSSGLPSDNISALAVDSSNNLWVGTDAGLAMYNGNNWYVFEQDTGGLLSNKVNCLAIGESDVINIGTDQGLNQRIGTNFLRFKSFSNLQSNNVQCLAFDPDGYLVVGTDKGFAIKAISNWIVHTAETDTLDSDNILDLAYDTKGNLWLATDRGVVKYINGLRITYNTEYTDLPSDTVNSIDFEYDEFFEYKWFGTNGGGAARFLESKPKGIDFSCKEKICMGEDIRIIPENVGDGDYIWKGPNGFSSEDKEIQINNAKFNHTGIYRLFAVSQGGYYLDSIYIEILPLPEFNIISEDDFVIINTTSIELKADPVNPDWHYLWSTGDNTPNIMVSQAGNYWLRVTNSNGCYDHDTVSVSKIDAKYRILNSQQNDFGEICLYDSLSEEYSILNESAINIVVDSITISPDNDDFVLIAGDLPVEITENETYDFRIVYSPKHPSHHNAEITVHVNNDELADLKMRVEGAGKEPSIDVILCDTLIAMGNKSILYPIYTDCECFSDFIDTLSYTCKIKMNGKVFFPQFVTNSSLENIEYQASGDTLFAIITFSDKEILFDNGKILLSEISGIPIASDFNITDVEIIEFRLSDEIISVNSAKGSIQIKDYCFQGIRQIEPIEDNFLYLNAYRNNSKILIETFSYSDDLINYSVYDITGKLVSKGEILPAERKDFYHGIAEIRNDIISNKMLIVHAYSSGQSVVRKLLIIE